MPTYDSNITLTPKGTRPTTSIVDKGTRPSTTIVAKGTRPTTTRVPKPYLEPFALLAEDGEELLMENEIVLVIQGAF